MGDLNNSEDGKPLVEWWTKVEGLTELKHCSPRPASEFFPDWFKKTPSMFDHPDPNETEKNKSTIKRCPAIPELLTQGYVLPMWCDLVLSADEGEWNSLNAGPFSPVSIHTKEQFLDHAPSWVQDEFRVVFKLSSPWNVRTPEGYSMYQMPMWYHFNRNWTVFPGSTRTDFYYEVNPQLLFHTKEKEIIIKQGEPIACYIPYKRIEYEYDVREATPEDSLRTKGHSLRITSKFSGAYKNEVRMRKVNEKHT